MDRNVLLNLSGFELSKAIHAKEVSCVEVMETYLDHIEKVNPKVNAIVTLVDRDTLLAAAKEKDEELAAGKDYGWMHGFPQAVKDLAVTKGIATTMGSPILKDNIPAEDEVMVRRMREAGAIIIGKTNTPEFGYGSNTYNKLFGPTGNPYDTAKTSGGSSGGAAVSLAIRMQAVADGSDYMGSLRNPAGWCNVFGYRPSLQCLPGPSPEIFVNNMLTNGPMGRTVEDVALLLGTMAGFDPSRPLSKPADPRLKELKPDNVQEKLKKDVHGTKIAWLGDWDGYLAMEDGVLETCEKTLEGLQEIGVEVTHIKPFYDPEKFWQQIWLPIRHFSACTLKPFIDAGHWDLLQPEAQWEYEGSRKAAVQDIFDAFVKRSEFYHSMMKVYEEYDFIAVPSAQLFAFDKNTPSPKEIAGRKMTTYHKYMEVVTHWTMGGNAIISAPAGFGGKDNMPIGIQFVAKPGFDYELLQFAYAYEKATRFTAEHPPVGFDF